ncbi:MAG TPA: tetratricopeptide repeat protein [Phycisphaerae bacterium]|nr:tetratricopeptide repeat protein [Phycisphaerae bacterium]HOJ75807.1 tetratricopeptide repeat protein [Phycisphaerae bacterium]HOM53193.1 tetratricopeptide repeat protein [Phycisphaerae bacterium]HON67096.1 tetratricopeptide repeat protein [Phycisphaerae bacterium]HPP28318.1 tetratricopeptide repeat protein [Phycisphaerae bacterium]
MPKLVKPVLRAIEHPRRETHRLVRSLWRTAIGASDEAAPRDVWRWTAPKYRWRTVILLLVNALLFAGLGFFAFWLRTGAYGPFSEENYWHAWWEVFDPTTERQVTLLDFLLRPIPVDQVPIMTIVLGLVLASMTAIPILVSMLYRFPFALIFTAIICFVAVFPWLAITVTLSCFIARWRPFRFSFRFATALLSMLPVIVYYVLATRGSDQALEHLTPVQIANLYLPWVFAIIAACTVMGIVLGIARLVNDRPGAIAPLMAVLFVLPIAIFEVKVGQDELYYRLIEHKFGPGSTTHFVDQIDASQTIEQIARKRREIGADQHLSQTAMEEHVRRLLQGQSGELREDWNEVIYTGYAACAEQQYEAVTACDRFLAKYPTSTYVPNVLYLKGRALDMRIDRDLFRRKGILRHYEDFPNMASADTWEMLARRYPDSPLASVAMHRLAILRVRAGRVDEAVAILRELVDRFSGGGPQTTQPEQVKSVWSLLAKRPGPVSLGTAPAEVAMQGRKLLALIESNRDPQQADMALRTLMSFDPRDAMYVRNLKQLLRDIETKYPLTLLRDNLEVLIAAAEPSQSLKIRALEACVAKLASEPDSDAYPQARYELGVAYQADNRPAEARAVFEAIVVQRASSPWALEAQRQLAEMGMMPDRNR